MNDLSYLAPTFLVVGLMIVLFRFVPSGNPHARALGAVTCICCSLRYILWRDFATLPAHQEFLQQAWAVFFLVVENLAVVSSMMVHFFMSRHVERTTTVDARSSSSLCNAPVDVLIATYNEGTDILERTIVGALAIPHPDLRVWVLDDGARSEIRDLAVSLGAYYRCRVKGKHAKAGNINEGMQQILREGRKPEFILLLDADFVPNGKILKRTLPLFEDANVGIVQTPQHFFNPDPVQSNLSCSSVWPDEQRFFFNVLMPSKDAWGAAFCCGTSAVFRVAAFEKGGGIATSTVTEDMLTTFCYEAQGYRTIFLNEPLSLGLSPEGLKEYLSQRSRWCLGAIQQIFTPWSFAGSGGHSWINRLAFFDTVLYWFSGALFKVLALIGPAVYWWTGTSIIHASLSDLVYWMGPTVAANFLFMYFLSGNRILPFVTDVTQLLSAFTVMRTVVHGLLRPFGHAFKVTAKGLSTTDFTVHWSLFLRFAGMAALTLLGLIFNSSSFAPAHGASGYELNVIWSVLSVSIFALAAMACVELPKRRRDERFITEELAEVRMADGTRFPCRLTDISLGGASMIMEKGIELPAGYAELCMDGASIVAPFRVTRAREENWSIAFNHDAELKKQLITKLFTGRYSNEVQTIDVGEVFMLLARRLVS